MAEMRDGLLFKRVRAYFRDTPRLKFICFTPEPRVCRPAKRYINQSSPRTCRFAFSPRSFPYFLFRLRFKHPRRYLSNGDPDTGTGIFRQTIRSAKTCRNGITRRKHSQSSSKKSRYTKPRFLLRPGENDSGKIHSL